MVKSTEKEMYSTKSIKTVRFFLILIILFFPLKPFFIAMGCNFKFTSTSEFIDIKGQCRAGIVTVYVWDKINNAKYYKKFITGANDKALYLINIGTHIIEKPTNDREPNYLNSKIISGSLIPKKDGNYIIDVDYPDDSIAIFELKVKKVK